MSLITNATHECAICGHAPGPFEPMAHANVGPSNVGGTSEPYYVCADCLPIGITPTTATRDDVALTLANNADECYVDEWSGAVMRIGLAVILCSQGDGHPFDSVGWYDTPQHAAEGYAAMYECGYGADESDAYITWHRGAYDVSVNYTHIGSTPRFRRAVAMVRLYQYANGDYGPCWHSEGNYCYMRLIDPTDPASRRTRR